MLDYQAVQACTKELLISPHLLFCKQSRLAQILKHVYFHPASPSSSDQNAAIRVIEPFVLVPQ